MCHQAFLPKCSFLCSEILVSSFSFLYISKLYMADCPVVPTPLLFLGVVYRPFKTSATFFPYLILWLVLLLLLLLLWLAHGSFTSACHHHLLGTDVHLYSIAIFILQNYITVFHIDWVVCSSP